MNTDTVIYALLGICVVIIMLVILSKPLKLLGRVAANGVIGIFAFIGMNFLLNPLSISVGVNLLTVLIVGILGFPGFISLYICALLL